MAKSMLLGLPGLEQLGYTLVVESHNPDDLIRLKYTKGTTVIDEILKELGVDADVCKNVTKQIEKKEAAK